MSFGREEGQTGAGGSGSKEVSAKEINMWGRAMQNALDGCPKMWLRTTSPFHSIQVLSLKYKEKRNI